MIKRKYMAWHAKLSSKRISCPTDSSSQIHDTLINCAHCTPASRALLGTAHVIHCPCAVPCMSNRKLLQGQAGLRW